MVGLTVALVTSVFEATVVSMMSTASVVSSVRHAVMVAVHGMHVHVVMMVVLMLVLRWKTSGGSLTCERVLLT